MTPLLHPYLVNDRFGDPALYLEFKFEKRGMLFDLGDLHRLEAAKILRLSDIFVSHAHVDHFIGFDQILRTLLGRDAAIRLYGPAGFIDQVAHRLGGYAWNLAERYDTDLTFDVMEVRSAGQGQRATFRFQNGFRPEPGGPVALGDGVLLDDGAFRVQCAVLDHRIPCLAFAIAEKAHVNVWKSRLEALDLPVGPWLRDLRHAVMREEPDETSIRVWSREAGRTDEHWLPLGRLKREVLRIVPGQKVGYVVDALYSDDNVRRIVALAKAADMLFIEAAFAEADAARAADRYHLTAAQAGRIARLAGVRRLQPFHFSPRYAGEAARLQDEAERAFNGLDAGEKSGPDQPPTTAPTPGRRAAQRE
jgi:ribonuclease Z